MINRLKDLIVIVFLLILSSGVTGYIVYSIVDMKHEEQIAIDQHKKPDSVIVKYISTPQVTNITNPTKVIVQSVTDTTYRKKVEKETIVTGLQIKGNEVDVDKIDSTGVKTEDVHKIDNNSILTMDNKGNVNIAEDKKAQRREKKKKVIRTVLNTGRDLLIGIVAFTIGKAI